MSEPTPQGNGNSITLFTIGFAGKTAQDFFSKLRNARVRRLIDVRLNNVSQLAGFTKKKDLEYFLHAIANIEYAHYQDLAPTSDILDRFKKKGEMDWAEYERLFNLLLHHAAPKSITTAPNSINPACCAASRPPRTATAASSPNTCSGPGATSLSFTFEVEPCHSWF